MATLIEVPDLDAGYIDVLETVMAKGSLTSPRGMPTRELLGVTILVRDAMNTMPLGCTERYALPALGVAEALQLIAGQSYPRLMTRITRNFTQFMDGEILQGAYGPRIRAQLPLVVELLRQDPDTRQAVIQIWDVLRDLMTGGNDIACTLALQFVLRNNVLELHSKMRSQDVWWGLAYDVYMFSELLGTVASLLRVQVGTITHTVTSLHAYERDFNRIDKTIQAGWSGIRSGFASVGLGWETNWDTHEIQGRANLMLRGVVPANADFHERWMIGVLERYCA